MYSAFNYSLNFSAEDLLFEFLLLSVDMFKGSVQVNPSSGAFSSPVSSSISMSRGLTTSKRHYLAFHPFVELV